MDKKERDRLRELDRQLVWHPFTQMQDYQEEEPLIIESAQGCTLVDIEGKHYLDGVSSLWVNVHGHRRREVDEAIRAQLDQVAHSTLLGAGNVPSVKLAEALLKIAPDNLSKVFYSDSGSTSVEVALKMAFQYWKQKGESQRTKFITLENAYHGDTVGSVSVGGIELFHSIFRPLLFDTVAIPDFDLLKGREIFAKHSHEVAACIIEPMVQGAAGMRIQPPGFVRGIRQLCDEFGILMICDEVATGFGRTGMMFAVEHEGVRPDFLCLAKGISAGYLPLAATLTTEEVFSAFSGSYTDFKTFFHGHSYTGNPLACAAALANLKIFEQDRVLEGLAKKISVMREGLLPFTKHPSVGEVRQLGLMVGVELAGYAVEERMAHRVCMEARKHGALFRPLGDVLVVMPPLAISSEEIQLLLSILYDSLQELT